MKEKWADSLKQKMAGFEQPVDDALWAGIAQASGARKIRWWPWVTTALASAAAVIAMVLLLRQEPVVEPVIVSSENSITVVEEEPSIEAPVEEKEIAVQKKKPVRLAQSTVNETDAPLPQEDVKDIPEEIIPPSAIVAKDVSEVFVEEEDWGEIIAEESAPKRSRMKIATSFYAQASPFGNRHSSGTAQVQEEQPEPDPGNLKAEACEDGEYGDPGDEEETKALGRSMNKAPAQSTSAPSEWTHAFPVQIGARVSFSWSERWSIETGLSFMYFNSWNASARQQMAFLGVPLYLNYTIGSARNFSFYASAGGQAFKCFAGNAPDKPWLFSCGMGAGAEYHLSPVVSLFVEPGADWYFHTGESQHYYSAHPFAFSLSLGVRLHL